MTNTKLERRRERIAAQKALGVTVGQHIIFGSSKTPVTARREHLDPRRLDFLRWRRATTEEVEAHQTRQRESSERMARQDAERARPEYRLASRFANTETEVWLKLPLTELQSVAKLFDEYGL